MDDDEWRKGNDAVEGWRVEVAAAASLEGKLSGRVKGKGGGRGVANECTECVVQWKRRGTDTFNHRSVLATTVQKTRTKLKAASEAMIAMTTKSKRRRRMDRGIVQPKSSEISSWTLLLFDDPRRDR
jgi:hypothetical protein